MLFITPAASARHAKDYYTEHMSRSDYYLKSSPEMAGQWHGLGADLLGLDGTVDKERYFALCDNHNPATGGQLTPHSKGNRRVLYDFTFDAPKSVTLALELGGDDRILAAFRAAVEDTMSEMEAGIQTRVRSRKRNESRDTANMVWGEFIHRTTRPVREADGSLTPDPQLHCHATVFNATYDTEESKWKAAEFSNLVRDKGYYQAAFHSRLAERIADLGYGVERDGNSFRLRGIDPQTVERFSRRTGIIEAEAERLGVTDNAKAKGQLGARTREAKDADGLSMPALRELWKARLSGDALGEIVEARRGHSDEDSMDAGKAMDYALAHCLERASALPEKELLKTALQASVGNASVNQIRAELLRDTIIRRERLGVRYATTRPVLLEEIAMSDFAKNGRGRHVKLGGATLPELDAELSAEQRDAALVILGSRDTVTALKGGAGTGKTRMMQATVKAIEATGKQVFTFAPSAEASRGVLRSEGFHNAETVERLLIDSKMQRTVKNQVLWVDEAGLLSVRDMKRLFDVAKGQNARIVLSGDTNQHTAVSRGDAMRILQRDAGLKTAELTQIRRQTHEGYRAAVKAISEGDAPAPDSGTQLASGIAMLEAMGAVRETAGDARYAEIAADYAGVTNSYQTGGKRKTALVVAPTHKEGERVTDAIRAALKADGRLHGPEREFVSLAPLGLTQAQLGDAREYQAGAVVQFHQNAKGFMRGERLTVTGASKEGVAARRADGTSAILLLAEAAKYQLYRTRTLALARGDRLRITQNGFTRETRRGAVGKKGKDRLNNGAVYEVEGFNRQGDILLSNGFTVPHDYGGIAHGYVVTSHASQGKTVDVALIALGQESFAAANREQFYVSVSRGKEAVRLYTDNKSEMLEAVQGSAARLSATELMQAAPAKERPSLMRRLKGLGVVQRAYDALKVHLREQLPEIIHHVLQEGMSHG